MSTTSSSSPSPAGESGVRSTFTAWLALFVLASAGFLALAVELSPAGLLTRMAPDLDASVASAGSLMALYALGNAVLVLPLTTWALRFTRRTALTATLLVFVAANVLVALSTDLAPALLARFVAGGAHGLLMALSPAVAVRLVRPDQRGRALAVVVGANTVGIAVGAPLTSLVGTTLGWQATFYAAAAMALLCAVLLWATLPPMRSQDGPRVPVLRALRLPGVARIGGAWALVMLGYLGVITYIDPYLLALGAPPLVVSGALFVFGTAGLLGVWLTTRIAARSRIAALVAMPLVMAAALVAMAFGIGNLVVVLVLLACWGVGFSGAVLIYQQVLLHVGHRAPETVMGIGVVLCQAGMAVGAALGGVVVDSAGVGAVPVLGAASAVAALLLLAGVGGVLRRATREQQPAAQEGRQTTRA
ncbi:MFS transporter [Nocardiopsis sp. B62]|uniref:MFS transporter n=1 Tax=Nocardiopsis sp. B62 TaxID=2824874 RepID=UPI001B398012|nr:MFS transporter [Nocardiopsis sp. B62]MBQ1080752.1 MFS transporter [Nocardiopsis sp. B62]